MSFLQSILGLFGLTAIAGLFLVIGVVILFDLVLTVIHGENFMDF